MLLPRDFGRENAASNKYAVRQQEYSTARPDALFCIGARCVICSGQ